MSRSVSDILMQQSGQGGAEGAQDVAIAFDLLHQGDAEGAARMFEALTKRQPNLPEAWFGWGQASLRMGQGKQAAQQFSRAVQLRADFAEAHNALGNTFQGLNRLSQAAQSYRQGLSAAPDNPVLHYNLGVTLKRMGDVSGAIENYQAAIRANPNYAVAYFSLGNALRETDRMAEAEQAYRNALRLKPDFADALCNLGGLLATQEKHAEALEQFDRVLTTVSQHYIALKNRSLMLYKLGRYQEGADAAFAALPLAGQDIMLHYHLGEMLYGMLRENQGDLARAYAARWVKAYPDNPVAKHMAAAAQGSATPSRAEDAYVRETFDRFAPDFESVLGRLGYQAPGRTLEALKPFLPARNDLVILDAGCGTGLCAPLLKPLAARLDGVDLSPGMLEKARARQIYDELAEAELGAFLSARPGRYDLNVAADVFCYFGELGDVFARTAQSLKPDGLFSFTVELLPEGDDAAPGYRLEPTGRYKHSRGYVARALNDAGFALLAQSDFAGRHELGRPVDSLLVVARRA